MIGSMRRHEKPLRRVNPSGKIVWVARWRDQHGKQHSAGTFVLQGACRSPAEDGTCCAQHAIDRAYDTENRKMTGACTVGEYADTWLQRHPRSERTNEGYRGKLKAALAVEIEDRPLRDWRMGNLRRRQVKDLVGVMLVKQKRSALGAVAHLRTLSAMFADAIEDEMVETNPWKGVRVKASDPRITKAPRPPVVWTWDRSRAFAVAAGAARGPSEALNAWRPIYAELMVLVLAECGLRLGELLPLWREDVRDGLLKVERTTYKGDVLQGTKTDHGKVTSGRLVPLPPELELGLRSLPEFAPGVPWLFPTPTGKLWRAHNFEHGVFKPARDATGMHIRPQDLRHSYVSQMAKVGADRAALAEIAGHSIQTQARYTHAIHDEATYAALRGMVGR